MAPAKKEAAAAAPVPSAPAEEKKSSVWFEKIAKIATDLGEVQYGPDDVRTILKAWRMEYQERKKAEKAAAKAAKAGSKEE